MIKFSSIKIGLIAALAFSMAACHSMNSRPGIDADANFHLEKGKVSFLAQKYQSAYHELIIPANEGNATAQYAVGYMYYYGKGVKKNKALGVQWIQKSAAQGYQTARQALQLIQKRK